MKKELYNLTNPQISIWTTEQFYSGTNVNNICGTVIISDTLNFDIFKQAIINVINSNDNFKIRFEKDKNILKQYIAQDSQIDIEIVKLKNKNEISDLEQKLVSQIFKITEEPAFKFQIFRFENSSGGFLVNIHHLLADSWTLGLICKKIVHEYSLLISERTKNKSETTSYINYLETEKQYINSNRYQKDKAYWEKIFANTPNIATIPSKDTYISPFSCKGNRDLFVIPIKLVSQINKFCKNHKVSIFNFFMAILSIYIYKINNIDNFVIGTPILNRSTFDEKNTNGMFVNMVPFLINVEKHNTFEKFLENISKNSIAMLRHQKYPYQKILDYVREKDNFIPNLYNIVLSYQITSTFTEENLKYETRWTFNGTSADDLTLQIYDLNEKGNLNLAYDYKKCKYTSDEIKILHNRLLNIISQVLTSKDLEISQIQILTKQESKEILNFNKTAIRYNKNIPIIKHFENQVKKTPNNIALTFKGSHLTYKELNEKANSLAHYLRENGVTNNSIVGIMLNRSSEMIIGILATLKAGGAYLPIDPEYPQDRISYMLQDSKTEFLLSHKGLAKDIKCKKIINIDLNNNLYFENKNNLKNISKPDDLAYIIYTSGSTGKPKGVMLMQKNYSNFLASMIDKIKYLKQGHKYSIISITTVSFDIFGFETLISLTCGLHLYLTDYFEQKYTDNLGRLIKNEKIDIIQTTPSVMHFHIDNAKNLSNFSKLKYVVLAGEQLPEDLVAKLKEIAPNVTIINGYGPSETTIFSSVNDVTNLEKVTIGKPIGNTEFYILDKDMNLLPKNTIGEIFIGGDGVGKGYLFNENLTKQNFLPNPFKKGIIYKTGDLGAWNNDGTITCSGRIDHQIKLRGLRVELEEIENKINKFKQNSKTKSIVILQGNSTNNYLHAFISSNTDINLQELKNYLLKNLPNYMVPSSYSFLNEFPTTPNGKIDRKALKSIKSTEILENIVEPKTETEKIIYREISNIIQNTNFGILDDFFSIGLDSLKIIQLSINLCDKLDTKLAISDFYKLTNIQKLAEFIDNNKNNQIYKITHLEENQEFYPVSSAQERIFYAQKLDENSVTYNVTGGIVIHKKISKNTIIDIFNTLINRHSAFRTSFIWKDNSLMQQINKTCNINIEFVKDKQTNFQKLVNNFAKPFELTSVPLLRVEVHYTKHKDTLILIDSHHIIVDGTSLSILINEFIKLLNNKNLDINEFEYLDYTVWENNFKNTENFKNLENYWENKFMNKEIPTINLPYDFPVNEKKDSKGNTISKKLDDKVFSSLQTLSQTNNISTYMLFLSAFYILLYKYTGQENIIIGSPTSARDLDGIQNLIGMFVNNMILENKINSSISFNDFVQNTKNLVFETMANEPYPYELLCRKFNNNFFDVMFTYQNNFDFFNKDFEVLFANNKTSKFNLSLEIIEATKTINLEYNTSLFKDETAMQILNHYINILKGIIKNPNQKIADISPFDELEQNKILYGSNNTYLPYPKEKTIAELIEEQALKTPEKIAITFKESALTFKELNDKSNMLAQYLRAQNIGRNDIIGIMLERSLELIVSIIAVLKSGACYIPIDPTFPKSRINYMLANSNSKLIIVDKTTISKTNFENKLLISLDKIEKLSKNTASLKHINLPDDNSYIIYTSGSTGTPKGVVLKHKALTNLTYHLNNYVEFLNAPSNNECMASVTTASFDIFIFETLICLQKGIKVAISTKDEQVIPEQLNNLINKNNVTAIQMTPSRMQLFIDNIEYIPDFKNLKYITLAGEPLPLTLVKRLKELGIKKVYNGYGPSETTVFSSFTDVTEKSEITIGKPLSNTYFYVLDNNLSPVPNGVAGELYIAGDGVGNGYLNKPNLTNASFIKNPFIDNSLMYKTGDLCKFLPNGELYYLGRVDNQIKIRGLRIELDEIENRILTFPFIQKAKVIKQTINEREFLSAYFIAEQRINIANLRSYLLEFLPNYMIPTYFTALDKFPYTPNGKIDKKALPLPKADLKNTYEKYIPPKTDLEIKLVKIFEDILNIKPIGINDDFFELGGDSILAMRLNIELLNISNNIKYSDIFNSPTISRLIKLIQNDKTKKNNDEILLNKDVFSDVLQNNLELPYEILEFKPKNILLTGSTGFLGIHILSSLLENTKSNIYCLIRKEPNISPISKLDKKLKYYFNDKYTKELNNRIKIVEGDITDTDLSEFKNNIDVVINSAAKVSHFGKYQDFYQINVLGVQHLLDFCKKYNKKFYQISTLSVSGNSFVDTFATYQNFEEETNFDESNFYIGQNLDNVYVKSKFEAEQIILKEIENGLEGYILRVGNLMPRFSDGKFQENVSENAYINRLSAFLKLKTIPDNIKNGYVEFTPIDFVADAITKIITHPNKNNCIYHLYNNNHIYINKLLKILNSYDYNINIIKAENFKEMIKEILSDNNKKNILNHLINDFNQNLDLDYEGKIKLKSDFTVNFLAKLNFKWPEINRNYIGYIISIIEEC